MPDLDIADLAASYGGKPVLRGVTLAIRSAEVVSVIGPSGSGKSTLLRVLVGLLRPDRGSIVVDGRPVDYTNKRDVRAVRERCAIVFQQFNLFQNMNVLENVCVAPVRIRRRPRGEVEAEAAILLRRVGLADKIKSYPDDSPEASSSAWQSRGHWHYSRSSCFSTKSPRPLTPSW